jgi:hypothetical protein
MDYPDWLNEIKTVFGDDVGRKRCLCGITYSINDFLNLEKPKNGQWQVDFLDENPSIKVWWPIRNCRCGSTICLGTARLREDTMEFEVLG